MSYFDSGTSALAEAVRQGIARQSPEPLRVLLPAYGCPNLLAAVLAAGAKPEFVDIDPQSLSFCAQALQRPPRPEHTLVLWVDMFGISTAERAAPELRQRMIHDLAQSYAPYLPGWQPMANRSVVSFGRAKPLSMTEGGALLTPAVSPASADAAPCSAGHGSLARLSVRAAVYNLCLGRLPYGILRSLPVGVGTTHFTPLDRIRPLGTETGRVVLELWRDLARRIADVESSTQAMCEVVDGAGMPLHPLVAQRAVKALWRVPVLHASGAAADFFADAAASLGVSRLYGRSLPELSGTSPEEARERWPKAWSLARRLTTLPTHGRLGASQRARLRMLLQASHAAG